MSTTPTANTDPVAALAERFPLLFEDLQSVLNQTETRFSPTQDDHPASFANGNLHFLLAVATPRTVRQYIKQLPSNAKVVQLFPDPDTLLYFLSKLGASKVVNNERWQPMLMQPIDQSKHLQHWFAVEHPRQWPWALMQGGLPPYIAEIANRFGGQLMPLLQHRVQALTQILRTAYKDAPSISEVLGVGERSPRILVLGAFGSAYQRFSARDIHHGLSSCGVESELRILRDEPTNQFDLLTHILAFHPDALIDLGKGRSAFGCLPEELGVISWDQDHNLISKEGVASRLGERDHVMVMVKEWLADAKRAGVSDRQASHVNLGTNPEVFFPSTNDCETEFDVLFVGNTHRFEDYRRIINLDAMPQNVQAIMLHARQRLDEWLASRAADEPFVIPDCASFLTQCSAEIGMSAAFDSPALQSLVYYFRYRIAHLLVRERFVRSLAGFRLGVFGHGWDRFDDLRDCVRPVIENGSELRELIHRSAINIHLHTWTVHHPRLYDTAAAGGFLLVGRIQESYPLQQVFDEGSELDTFGSIPQLNDRIRYYLEHDQEREAMSLRASERAKRDHTMANRMDSILNRLKGT